ncbi:receptor-type protein kinase, putative [Bodo saltans]|uniref:Receptor-type protein kinase, putative n=1 Tax=Bodo saltans TaxID=75058 RepID=A0A0S4JGJ0_BODSA|nr:receptor-type protein kinase, putative [Bodo saltans]|eukprot:CUG89295.1 receptor-type protein kinase, putative [Bodo saltans]
MSRQISLHDSTKRPRDDDAQGRMTPPLLRSRPRSPKATLQNNVPVTKVDRDEQQHFEGDDDWTGARSKHYNILVVGRIDIAQHESYAVMECGQSTDKLLLTTAPLACRTLSARVSLQRLQFLDLSGSGEITKQGLASVAALQQLRHLDLSDSECRIWCEDFAPVAALQQLQYLDLSGCTWLSDESFSHVATLLHLRYLALRDCSITDAGVSRLRYRSSSTSISVAVTRSQMRVSSTLLCCRSFSSLILQTVPRSRTQVLWAFPALWMLQHF